MPGTKSMRSFDGAIVFDDVIVILSVVDILNDLASGTGLVGRNRVRDGVLLRTVLAAKATLAPWLLYDLVRARRARNSWQEVFFQLYSIGSVPASPAFCVGPETSRSLRLVCISDTHLCHKQLPPLPDGDVLIHCGDFTNHGSLDEVLDFVEWFAGQPHSRKLCVPGNHDMLLDEDYYENYWSDWSRVKESPREAKAAFASRNIELLIDQGTSIEGVTFYGSPWVAQGHDWKTAFNKQDSELENCWARIPENSDVLLTHMPPYGKGDRLEGGEHVGCSFLAEAVKAKRPKLHVFGHVHTDTGIFPADTSAEPSAAMAAWRAKLAKEREPSRAREGALCFGAQGHRLCECRFRERHAARNAMKSRGGGGPGALPKPIDTLFQVLGLLPLRRTPSPGPGRGHLKKESLCCAGTFHLKILFCLVAALCARKRAARSSPPLWARRALRDQRAGVFWRNAHSPVRHCPAKPSQRTTSLGCQAFPPWRIAQNDKAKGTAKRKSDDGHGHGGVGRPGTRIDFGDVPCIESLFSSFPYVLCMMMQDSP
ncbi:unnamed protein product [Symbiodinium sp. KB8]|nr:unnamed protein product [Symbiodinium sp. KB8]